MEDEKRCDVVGRESAMKNIHIEMRKFNTNNRTKASSKVQYTANYKFANKKLIKAKVNKQ